MAKLGRPRKNEVRQDVSVQQDADEDKSEIVSVVGNESEKADSGVVVEIAARLEPAVVDLGFVSCERLTPLSKPCPPNQKIVKCDDWDEITKLSFSGKLVGHNPKTKMIQVKLD